MRVPRFRRLRAIAGPVLLALLTIQCDLIVPPDPQEYDLQPVGSPNLVVSVGDTLEATPSARLLVGSQEQATQWQAVVVSGSDIVEATGPGPKLIVLKRGQAVVRVRPLNAQLADTSKSLEFTIFAVVPRAPIASSDTIYSIGDTLTPVANPETNDEVPILGVPASAFTWSIVGSDSAARLISAATGQLESRKNGDVTLRVSVDSIDVDKVIKVRQRVARVDVSPAGAPLTAVAKPYAVAAVDARGVAVAGATPTWTSLNTAVATVNAATGDITPVSSGQVTIQATVATVKGSAVTTVSVPSIAAPNAWVSIPSGTSQLLQAVWGASGSDVFVAGNGGAILYHNGTTLTAQSSGVGSNLLAVWGTSKSDVFAVGDNGRILHFDGTNWSSMTSGTTQSLRGVWGSAPNDVFAVGDAGVILRYNGTSWSPMASGTTANIRAVWGSSASNVYVLLTGGAIRSYNGATWSAQNSGTGFELFGAWGTSASNVYAVGASGTLRRFDGSTWSGITTGVSEGWVTVTGTSPTDVYMAGGNFKVHRYNGAAVSELSLGVSGGAVGAWTSSAGEVWVVGTGGQIMRGYRGASVTVAPTTATLTTSGGTQQLTPAAKNSAGATLFPAPAFTWTSSNTAVATVSVGGLVTAAGNGSTTICATAPGGAQACADVTVSIPGQVAAIRVTPALPTVGIGNTVTLTATAKSSDSTVLSGVSFTWSSESPAVATVNSQGVVTGVSAGPSKICATSAGIQGCTTVTVGTAVASITVGPAASVTTTGSSTSFTATAKDGSGAVMSGITFTWTSLNPNVASVDPSTGSITAVASGQATIAASAGGATGYKVITVSLAQNTPVNLWLPQTTPGTNAIQGIWAASASDVFVSGSGGALWRFNGSVWNAQNSNTTQSRQGLWGSSPTDVFSVGFGGTILHFDGSSWTPQTSNTSNTLIAVWGSSPRDVFAVGQNGTIMHFDGSAWSAMTSGTTTAEFRAVWGASSSDVYAAAQDGTVLHYDGSSWSPMTVGTPLPMSGGLWGRTHNDIFISGDNGKVQRGQLSTWAPLTTSTSEHLTGIWGGSATDVYATGANGAITRFNGTSWTTLTSGTSQLLWKVSGFGSDVFVVGNGGTILRGVRGATMTVSPSAPNLTSAGQTQQLTALVKDAANTTLSGVALTWTSSNESAATVSTGGLVTAVADGATNVCATASGGLQTCVSVTVGVQVHLVHVCCSMSFGSGTQTLTAEPKDENLNVISNTSVIWTSSNTGIATVNSSGVVTPVSSGQVVISASAGGKTGSVLITIAQPSVPAVNLWVTDASGTTADLYGVWGSSTSSIFAAGNTGVIRRYNGSAWVESLNQAGESYRSIWGVGTTILATALTPPRVAKFDGSAWQSSLATAGSPLHGVWLGHPDIGFVVGLSGEILQYDPAGATEWLPRQSNVTTNLFGVWGSEPAFVWAVGAGGTFLKWNAVEWTAISGAGTADLTRIWGQGNNDLFLAGAGTALRYNGSTFTNIHSGLPAGVTIQGLWGTSSNDVYASLVAVDGSSRIYRYNGAAWTLSDSAAACTACTGATGLHSIFGVDNKEVIAVGAEGLIRHGYRGATVSLAPLTPTLTAVGATVQLTPTAKDAGGATIGGTATYRWTSSDESRATVSPTGLVTAVANGGTMVCATANGGAQGCTTVTVSQQTASVSVIPSGADLAGGTTPFTAEAKDANGHVIPGKTVTWSSLNTNVATVNSSGVVTGVASGQTPIAATVDGFTAYGLITMAIPGAAAANVWADVSNPLGGQTFDIKSIWGSSGSDVYAVASNPNGTVNSRVLHFNGSAWSVIYTTSTISLGGVWGTGPGKAYVAGFVDGTGQTVLLEFTGTGAPTQHSLGSHGYTHRVWGSAPNDIFIGGQDNWVVRFDGAAGNRMTIAANGQTQTGLFGFSRDVIHAIFTINSFFKFDGANWIAQPVMNAGKTALWGTSSSNVHTVGPDLEKYNGTSWSVTGPGKQAVAIWGSSQSDVYAVGSEGRIHRYDGSSWVTTSGPAVTGMTLPNHMLSVWTTSNSDVFAGLTNGFIMRGYRGATVALSPSTPTLTSFGATQQMTPSAKDAGNATISGVTFADWTSTNTSVATVSQTGLVTAGTSNGTTTICVKARGGAQACTLVTVDQAAASITLSASSASLTNATTTLSATAQDANSNAIAAQEFTWTSQNTAVATVSSSGVVSPVASGQTSVSASADGITSYATITVAVPAVTPVNLWAEMSSGTTQQLNGVWGMSATDVFAVGFNGTIRRYNGSSWSGMTSNTSNLLLAVGGPTSSNVYAVNDGQALRFNGSTWGPETNGTASGMNSLWTGSPTALFGAGFGGMIRRGTGTTWVQETSGTTAYLKGVWGSSPTNVFAVGGAGVIRRFDGSNWNDSPSGTTDELYAVWGASESSVYAIGLGTFIRFNGSSWSPLTTPGSGLMVSMWGANDSDIYAVGTKGGPKVIRRYNGATWTEQYVGSACQSGCTDYLLGVWGTSNGDVFAVGYDGTIVRGIRGATVTLAPLTPTITAIGNTQQLTPTAKTAGDVNLTDAITYTWSSTDSSKVTISSSGLATAVGSGSAVICATAQGGAFGCTTVTVDQQVASVVVSPSGASIVGGTTTFSAVARDANGNTILGQSFDWTSTNTAVATVGSSSGTVSPLSAGQSSIRATAEGVNGYGLVTVAASGTAVNLWAAQASVPTGASFQAAWAANPTNVFAVGQNGVVVKVDGFNVTRIDSGSTSGFFYGISGTSATDVWVAGDDLIRHYNGVSWTTSRTGLSFPGIWAVAPNEVYATEIAVGRNYLIRYNGSTWTRIDSISVGSGGFWSVWGTARDNAFVLLGTGSVQKWNGSALSTSLASTNGRQVMGVSATEAYVAVAGGNMRHTTDGGQNWQSLAAFPGGIQTCCWGVLSLSNTDIWASVSGGQSTGFNFARYNGATWDTVNTGDQDLHGAHFAGTSTGRVWAFGSNGKIWKGIRGATASMSPSSPTISSSSPTVQLLTSPDDGGTPVNAPVITWSTSNPGVATVSPDGLVTRVSTGTATITATYRGGLTATALVTSNP